MKKTMFITSVIMVVVMAIALTTSSLAWFSANGAATVTTSTVTVKAAVPTGAEGLLICNDASSFSNTAVPPIIETGSVTLGTGDDAANYVGLKPSAPYGKANDGTDAVAAEDLVRALGALYFTGKDVTTADGTAKWAATGGSGIYAGHVYVANASDNAKRINATVTLDTTSITNGNAGSTLYVAVLASKTANQDTTLNGISSGSALEDKWDLLTLNTFTSAGVKDNTPSSVPFANTVATAGETVASTITTAGVVADTNSIELIGRPQAYNGAAYSQYVKCLIIAWYSSDLTNFNAETTLGAFTVTFGMAS